MIAKEISDLRKQRDRCRVPEDNAKIKDISGKMRELKHQEVRHDFALLELEGEIIRDEYFELPHDVESFPEPRLVLSGYLQDPDTLEYRHSTNF
jgi:hypothetical protein